MIIENFGNEKPRTNSFRATLWKRPTLNGPIIPLDISDNIDFVIVSVTENAYHGQFIFSQKTLVNQGILSHQGRGGKLAFRVYPSWVKLDATAAIKTQQWQLQHFFLTSQKESIDRLCNLLQRDTDLINLGEII